jgi:hypothetical protein
MSKNERPVPWWFSVIYVTMIAAVFAAVPFWTRGLTLTMAEIAAAIIFPSVAIFFAVALWREGRN